jgi:hypothetical protein
MTPNETQKQAWRVGVSRAFKSLFHAVPIPRRWLFRLIFLSDDGTSMRRAGDKVLRHLKYFCFADRSIFGGLSGSNDSPFLLGVREGRRQVWLEIMRNLNLDEGAVQKIMEIDDGR